MLRYQYEAEPTSTQITGYAGLLPYLDLACVLGLLEAADEHIGIEGGEQGWRDRQHLLSLVLLNVAGGEVMDDIQMLEADPGLCRMVREAEGHRLPHKERRERERRFRKGRTRTFPSPNRICEWLEAFHDPEQEKLRVEGKAFIPQSNAHLAGLGKVNDTLLAAVQRHAPCRVATLDTDATIQETHKREALFCYQGYRAYQPLNTYWAETGLLVDSQFRDGNVPAGFGIMARFREVVPKLQGWGVEEFFARLDSAGYQYDVLKFLATGGRCRSSTLPSATI